MKMNVVFNFALATALACGAATAQDIAPAGGSLQQLPAPEKGTPVFEDEVEVVALRLAESPEALRRIPGSIDILDQETLERSRVFNLNEALAKIAGLRVRDEEGFALRPNIGIRGLNPTRSGKVLLLEDGLPFTYAPYGDNASYYHPPIERFETIEVLKGSGQIAYGPVTVGGVINYITPDPPTTPGGSFALSGGTRDFVSAHARYGGTWGRTGLLLDALRKEGDGARDNVHSRLYDLSAKSLIGLGARHTLTLKGNYYGEDSNVTYSGLREAEYRADPRQNPFAHDFFYGDRYGASVRHTALLGADVLFATQAYVSSFRRHWWRQSSNSSQRPNDAADPACGGMANLDTTCGNEGRLRRYLQWGVEPRMRANHRLFGVRSEADFGVRAHFEDQQRRQENGDSPDARSGRLVENNARANEAFSGFLQNRFLAGRFTITPGVRIEHVRYARTNRLAASGLGVSGRTALTQWVPGLGVAFNPAGDRLTVFAGVHRGFAPPRTEDVISNASGAVVELDPELSWNSELGLRATPAAGVRIDATVFRMDYENQVVPASLAGGVGATLTNGGETLHQGAEASVRVNGAPLLGSAHDPYLRLSATWLPVARFEGVRTSAIPAGAAMSVSRNRIPYVPERSLTASAGYAHPSGLDAMVEAVYVSRQFSDDLNTREPSTDGQRGLIPASVVWNATIGYAWKPRRATVFVTVKNLADATFIVDRSRGIIPGSPRLLQGGVKLAF